MNSRIFFVRSLTLLFILASLTGPGMAQSIKPGSNTPAVSVMQTDYYQSAYRLTGANLRNALHNIIKGHNSVSYSSLWTHYQTTDKKSNGKVWDMYSDVPIGTPAYEYTFVTDQCGNYSGEGSCYNREHSFPQSWFNSQTIPSSDLFHIYPTDGYVNGKRSNYNYGEVGTASWTSTNGSKLGTSSTPGFTGTVFEPIDAYKGDLARSAFYMSVRYFTEDGGWASSDGTNKSDLLQWYSDVLYKWHIKDTVSAKEINRNTAVYGIQNNRNPFIDHPEFAAEIWKTTMPPSVEAVTELSTKSLLIDFSRYLDSASAVTLTNILCDQSVGSPVSIQWGVNNDISKVIVTFSSLTQGVNYKIQIKNYKSFNSVAMNDTSINYTPSGSSAVWGGEIRNASFSLLQNYPNPFNPVTEIRYNLAKAGNVSLKIFNMTGELMSEPVNNYAQAGEHTVKFDASNLPSGIYYYQMSSDGYIQTRKMALIK